MKFMSYKHVVELFHVRWKNFKTLWKGKNTLDVNSYFLR